MNLSNTAKGLIKGILVLSAIGLIAGIFFIPLLPDWIDQGGAGFIFSTPVQDAAAEETFAMPPFASYAIGLVLGAAVSIAKTILLEKAINQVTELEEFSRAKMAMRTGYAGRFLMTAVLFLLAVFVLGVPGIIGAFVGTLAMSFSPMFGRFFEKKETLKDSSKAKDR